jgi:hypothetical protein
MANLLPTDLFTAQHKLVSFGIIQGVAKFFLGCFRQAELGQILYLGYQHFLMFLHQNKNKLIE